MKCPLILALLVAFVIPTISFAMDKEHAVGEVKCWLPDDWKASEENEVLVAMDPNEEVIVSFWVIDASDLEKALGELDKELGKVMKDAKPSGEPSVTKINEMNAIVLEGTGAAEGTKVQ